MINHGSLSPLLLANLNAILPTIPGNNVRVGMRAVKAWELHLNALHGWTIRHLGLGPKDQIYAFDNTLGIHQASYVIKGSTKDTWQEGKKTIRVVDGSNSHTFLTNLNPLSIILVVKLDSNPEIFEITSPLDFNLRQDFRWQAY